MSSPEPSTEPGHHPLLSEIPRLETLKNRMYSTICSVMGVTDKPDERPALAGGKGPDDVLSEALPQLLKKPASYTKNWEALGMTIARRRAIDAVRRAASGRRGKLHPDQEGDGDAINLVPIDDEVTQHAIDRLVANDRLPSEPDPEELVLEAERQALLWNYAQELLNSRDQEIYRRLHHQRATIDSVAEEFELTGRRVRQIMADTHRKLAAAAHTDPAFPNRSEVPNPEGDPT